MKWVSLIMVLLLAGCGLFSVPEWEGNFYAKVNYYSNFVASPRVVFKTNGSYYTEFILPAEMPAGGDYYVSKYMSVPKTDFYSLNWLSFSSVLLVFNQYGTIIKSNEIFFLQITNGVLNTNQGTYTNIHYQ